MILFVVFLGRWDDAESILYLKCVWQLPAKCSVGDCGNCVTPELLVSCEFRYSQRGSFYLRLKAVNCLLKAVGMYPRKQ